LWPAAAAILLAILLAFLACLAAALIVSFGWLLTISFGPLHELLWFNPFFQVRGRYLIAAEGLIWLAAWVALRRTRREKRGTKVRGRIRIIVGANAKRRIRGLGKICKREARLNGQVGDVVNGCASKPTRRQRQQHRNRASGANA